MDSRILTLAKNIVNFSCEVKKGEKVLIEAYGIDHNFVEALVAEIYKAGGIPFVELFDNRILRSVYKNITKEHAETMAKFASYRMNEMDAYIGVRGGENSYELSDTPGEKLQIVSNYYSLPVHHEIRVKKTKWVVMRWPTQGMSANAKVPTAAFEDFYFNVCNLDYKKMADAMTPLVELMNKTDKVRIIAKDTDLSFSIKGIGAVKCSGNKNIPDGEVYTAPVKDSVNGVITYNAPSTENGFEYKNVQLTFKNGKIINATSNNTEGCNKIFDTDAGARYVGEFALGVNPYVIKPMGDILFDEKISGSIHFTPGACYDDAWNGNESSVHWDLVQMHSEEYGGGEIYFDDVLIRKNGRFVLPELFPLNPENLM